MPTNQHTRNKKKNPSKKQPHTTPTRQHSQLLPIKPQANSETLTQRQVIQLQQTIGNRQVSQLLTPASSTEFMIQREAAAVTHDNQEELQTAIDELNRWLGQLNILPEGQRGQYQSQIEGVRDAMIDIKGALEGDNLRPFQQRKRFGKVTHDGQIYLLFHYTVSNGNVKLDGIVKNPSGRQIATREQNTTLNTEAHAFMQGQVGDAGSLKLEADTERLVETYYGYGYRLLPAYFNRDRPEGIDAERWAQLGENRNPTLNERASLSRAWGRGRPGGAAMWQMVRDA